MTREPRFPGIDWYCDHCGALLNTQKHFDDHKYTWKCTRCGFKNSISWDNIRTGDSSSMKFLLYLLGFLSYVSLWTGVMLAVAIFAFHADRNRYYPLFFACIGLYSLTFILGLIIEFVLRHTTFSRKNLIFVAFRNLKEDILAPFLSVKELINSLLSSITRRFSKKYIWKNNKAILGSAVVYVIIIITEFIALSRIIGFSLNDWNQLLATMLSFNS